jgi:UDP-glucose 4-epimerase
MILIVGGAGYIGSQINKHLNIEGFETIVYDNLIYGHESSVKWGHLIIGDLNNIDNIREVFAKYDIEAVMHFAAFAYVGESVEHPEKYYTNNVSSTLNLLSVMREFGCRYLIFSSTCSTYGNPQTLTIDETHPQSPINPYGRSKLMIEQILEDYLYAYGMKYVSLRYFNAAGADLETEIGENHDPETHLIPLILDAAIGKRKSIEVYGTDYKTKDGSAVRDYIHVSDIAKAHLLALQYLKKTGISDAFNLGNGNGYSVLEVINAAKDITGKEFKVILGERRSGDPAILIGNASKAKKILGWSAPFSDLKTIIGSAWRWHQKMNRDLN